MIMKDVVSGQMLADIYKGFVTIEEANMLLGYVNGDPFLCEGVSETMNAGLLQASDMAEVPERMITAASGQLLPIHRAKQPIICTSATVFQVFLQYLHDVII